jgi:hypothetical protein
MRAGWCSKGRRTRGDARSVYAKVLAQQPAHASLPCSGMKRWKRAQPFTFLASQVFLRDTLPGR